MVFRKQSKIDFQAVNSKFEKDIKMQDELRLLPT